MPSPFATQLFPTTRNSGATFTLCTQGNAERLPIGTPGEEPNFRPAYPDPEIPGPRHPDPNLPIPGDPPNMPAPMTDPPPSEPAPTPSIQPPVK